MTAAISSLFAHFQGGAAARWFDRGSALALK